MGNTEVDSRYGYTVADRFKTISRKLYTVK